VPTKAWNDATVTNWDKQTRTLFVPVERHSPSLWRQRWRKGRQFDYEGR